MISINVRPMGARGQRGREEAERAALEPAGESHPQPRRQEAQLWWEMGF